MILFFYADCEKDAQQPGVGKADRKRMLEYELTQHTDGCPIGRKSLSGMILRWWGAYKIIYPTFYRVAYSYRAVSASPAPLFKACFLRRGEHRHEEAKQMGP